MKKFKSINAYGIHCKHNRNFTWKRIKKKKYFPLGSVSSLLSPFNIILQNYRTDSCICWKMRLGSLSEEYILMICILNHVGLLQPDIQLAVRSSRFALGLASLLSTAFFLGSISCRVFSKRDGGTLPGWQLLADRHQSITDLETRLRIVVQKVQLSISQVFTQY